MKVALHEYQEHRANLTNSMSTGPVNGRIMWFIIYNIMLNNDIFQECIYVEQINNSYQPN